MCSVARARPRWGSCRNKLLIRISDSRSKSGNQRRVKSNQTRSSPEYFSISCLGAWTAVFLHAYYHILWSGRRLVAALFSQLCASLFCFGAILLRWASCHNGLVSDDERVQCNSSNNINNVASRRPSPYSKQE